jgi:hypothetical protein
MILLRGRNASLVPRANLAGSLIALITARSPLRRSRQYGAQTAAEGRDCKHSPSLRWLPHTQREVGRVCLHACLYQLLQIAPTAHPAPQPAQSTARAEILATARRLARQSADGSFTLARVLTGMKQAGTRLR